MARKSVNPSPSAKLRIPEEDGECFACVTRMTGNGMCKVDVWYNDEILSDVTCFIRGKFKSKSKKQNLVSKDSFIIVGLRLWSSDLTKCDLLEVFQANNIHELSSISSSFKLFSSVYLNSTQNIISNTSEKLSFSTITTLMSISLSPITYTFLILTLLTLTTTTTLTLFNFKTRGLREPRFP